MKKIRNFFLVFFLLVILLIGIVFYREYKTPVYEEYKNKTIFFDWCDPKTLGQIRPLHRISEEQCATTLNACCVVQYDSKGRIIEAIMYLGKERKIMGPWKYAYE